MFTFDVALLSYIFGVIVVLIFCTSYFNEPKYPFSEDEEECLDNRDRLIEPVCPRFMTNRYQYNLYLFVFILLTEILYFILVEVLPVFLGKKDLPIEYNALAAALIITGLMPNIQSIKKLLDRMKTYLHEKARIPREGQEFYRFLKSNPIHFSPAVIQKMIADEEYNKALDQEDFHAPRESLEYNWAKLSYLIYHLNEWSKSSPLRSCIWKKELRWSSIKKSYKDLQDLMTRCKAEALTREERTGFINSLSTLLNKTYRLITCALFAAEKPSRDLNHYTVQIGYGAYSEQIFVPSNKHIALFSISSLIGILVGAAIAGLLTWILEPKMPWAKMPITARTIVFWVLYGVPLLTLPVVFVLFAKRHLSFMETVWPMITPHRQFKNLRDRPWHIYAIVTVVAYFVGVLSLVLVSLLAGHLQTNEIMQMGTYRRYAIWALVCLVTAGFVAYRLDSLVYHKKHKVKRALLKLAGALSQGSLSALAIMFSFIYVINKGNFDISALESTAKSRLFCYAVTCFIIGCILFFTSEFNPRFVEKRRFKRDKLSQVHVDLRLGEYEYQGSLGNISKEGALVLSDITAAVGDIIHVSLENGVSAEGKVVDSAEGETHVQFDSQIIWEALKDQPELEGVPV